METIMRFCRCDNIQALEIIALEKCIEEDANKDGNDVQNS